MKDNLTYIGIIIDRSGSMKPIRKDVIGGFNGFIEEQKKHPGEAIVTLCQFDHEYELVVDGVPLQQVQPLTEATYKPRGSTALLDAIGRTINSIGIKLAAMPEADRPSKVIVLIMTDGDENHSREFNREQIREMITHQREKYAWEFVFIGANQDSFAEAATIGVATAANFAATSEGTEKAFSGITRGVSAYRSHGTYTK